MPRAFWPTGVLKSSLLKSSLLWHQVVNLSGGMKWYSFQVIVMFNTPMRNVLGQRVSPKAPCLPFAGLLQCGQCGAVDERQRAWCQLSILPAVQAGAAEADRRGGAEVPGPFRLPLHPCGGCAETFVILSPSPVPPPQTPLLWSSTRGLPHPAPPRPAPSLACMHACPSLFWSWPKQDTVVANIR